MPLWYIFTEQFVLFLYFRDKAANFSVTRLLQLSSELRP